MSGPLGVLPGLYYDPVRKKYFPGQAPAAVASPEPSEQLGIRNEEIEAGPSRIARPIASRVVGRSRQVAQLLQRSTSLAVRTDISKSAILHPAYADKDPTITALACTEHTLFSGSNGGCLSSLAKGRGTEFTQDTFLSSPIIDVHIEKDVLLAASFGPQALQLVRSVRDVDPGGWQHRTGSSADTPRKIRAFDQRRDVWCASLKGGAATFGGNGWLAHSAQAGDRLVYDKTSIQTSDVISLSPLDKFNVYAGQRSGHVVHYDFRVPRRDILTRRTTPVAALRKIQSVVGGLVVAGLKNEIAIYDVRFAKDPVHQLQGHRNDYHLNLAVTSTEDDQVILAAGSDHRIRAWAALTGEAVHSTGESGPLTTVFDSPVRCMAWSGDELMVGNGKNVQVYSRGGVGGWKWDII